MTRTGGSSATGYRIAALGLIVAGALGLAYGKFRVADETHSAQIGSVRLDVREHRTVNVPIWIGLGAIAAGAVVLLSAGRGARA